MAKTEGPSEGSEGQYDPEKEDSSPDIASFADEAITDMFTNPVSSAPVEQFSPGDMRNLADQYHVKLGPDKLMNLQRELVDPRQNIPLDKKAALEQTFKKIGQGIHPAIAAPETMWLYLERSHILEGQVSEVKRFTKAIQSKNQNQIPQEFIQPLSDLAEGLSAVGRDTNIAAIIPDELKDLAIELNVIKEISSTDRQQTQYNVITGINMAAEQAIDIIKQEVPDAEIDVDWVHKKAHDRMDVIGSEGTDEEKSHFVAKRTGVEKVARSLVDLYKHNFLGEPMPAEEAGAEQLAESTLDSQLEKAEQSAASTGTTEARWMPFYDAASIASNLYFFQKESEIMVDVKVPELTGWRKKLKFVKDMFYQSEKPKEKKRIISRRKFIPDDIPIIRAYLLKKENGSAIAEIKEGHKTLISLDDLLSGCESHANYIEMPEKAGIVANIIFQHVNVNESPDPKRTRFQIMDIYKTCAQEAFEKREEIDRDHSGELAELYVQLLDFAEKLKQDPETSTGKILRRINITRQKAGLEPIAEFNYTVEGAYAPGEKPAEVPESEKKIPVAQPAVHEPAPQQEAPIASQTLPPEPEPAQASAEPIEEVVSEASAEQAPEPQPEAAAVPSAPADKAYVNSVDELFDELAKGRVEDKNTRDAVRQDFITADKKSCVYPRLNFELDGNFDVQYHNDGKFNVQENMDLLEKLLIDGLSEEIVWAPFEEDIDDKKSWCKENKIEPENKKAIEQIIAKYTESVVTAGFPNVMGKIDGIRYINPIAGEAILEAFDKLTRKPVESARKEESTTIYHVVEFVNGVPVLDTNVTKVIYRHLDLDDEHTEKRAKVDEAMVAYANSKDGSPSPRGRGVKESKWDDLIARCRASIEETKALEAVVVADILSPEESVKKATHYAMTVGDMLQRAESTFSDVDAQSVYCCVMETEQNTNFTRTTPNDKSKTERKRVQFNKLYVDGLNEALAEEQSTGKNMYNRRLNLALARWRNEMELLTSTYIFEESQRVGAEVAQFEKKSAEAAKVKLEEVIGLMDGNPEEYVARVHSLEAKMGEYETRDKKQKSEIRKKNELIAEKDKKLGEKSQEMKVYKGTIAEQRAEITREKAKARSYKRAGILGAAAAVLLIAVTAYYMKQPIQNYFTTNRVRQEQYQSELIKLRDNSRETVEEVKSCVENMKKVASGYKEPAPKTE